MDCDEGEQENQVTTALSASEWRRSNWECEPLRQLQAAGEPSRRVGTRRARAYAIIFFQIILIAFVTIHPGWITISWWSSTWSNAGPVQAMVAVCHCARSHMMSAQASRTC